MSIATPFSVHQVAEREGPGALRRISYPFRSAVAPGETKLMKLPVPRDGTVEFIRIRIYAGAELSVHIVPYVLNDRQTRRNLLTFPAGGKPYVDGDDDTFIFAIREPVLYGDKDVIIVEAVNALDPAATNADGTLKYPAAQFTYDFAVDVEIDFAAGPWPFLVVTDIGGGALG